MFVVLQVLQPSLGCFMFCFDKKDLFFAKSTFAGKETTKHHKDFLQHSQQRYQFYIRPFLKFKSKLFTLQKVNIYLENASENVILGRLNSEVNIHSAKMFTFGELTLKIQSQFSEFTLTCESTWKGKVNILLTF